MPALVSVEPSEDYIILASPFGPVKSPGSRHPRRWNAPRKWDISEGYGFKGGSARVVGTNLSRFEVDIYIWLDSHWVDWALFSQAHAVPSGPVTTGVGIIHPQLSTAPLKISSAVIEDVSQFEQDENGGWTCTIKMAEFARPHPVPPSVALLALPAASKPLPTATDAASAELAAKSATFASLAAGGSG